MSNNTALAPIPQTQTDTLRAIMGSVERILPPHVGIDEFRGALMLHLQTGKKLASCTPQSIVACVLKAATSGWVPGRDCTFTAYWSSKEKTNVAQCVPGYQGMTRELYATGGVTNFPPPQVVREGDRFEVDFGSGVLTHVPKYGGPARNAQPIIAFYQQATLASGERVFDVMDLSEVEAIRNKVKDWEKTPWATDFPEMGRKTVTRRLYKRLQMPRPARRQADAPTLGPDGLRAAIADIWGDTVAPEVLQGRSQAALPEATNAEPEWVEDGEYDAETSAAMDAELAAQEQMELEASQ